VRFSVECLIQHKMRDMATIGLARTLLLLSNRLGVNNIFAWAMPARLGRDTFADSAHGWNHAQFLSRVAVVA
jgi:hypothetical protein